MGFIKKDRLKDVLQSISGLVDKQVLVGIPDSTAGRKDEGAPLSNAEIGYIQENGAPEINLPARPFNQQWNRRYDLTLTLRRKITRTYPVLNLLSAEVQSTTDSVPPVAATTNIHE